MTKYVQCRLCKNFIPLNGEVEKPQFSIKENGVEEAVCRDCFKKLIEFFKK